MGPRTANAEPAAADAEPAVADTVPVVAYQGRAGAFSDVAARELVPGAQTRGYDSFDAVAAALAAGEVDFAVLPVENAIAGPVPRNYELLWEHAELRVRGELALPVELCLIGAPARPASPAATQVPPVGTQAPLGGALDAIREVRSHPVALEQVRGLLAAHPGWKRSITTDTAGAVAEIVALHDPAVAAIGPALAAELYGGTILARGVQDARENYTRFFLLARSADSLSPGDERAPPGDDRTPPVREAEPPGTRACVGIAVADRPGSLRDALSAFADRAIDLRFLIARPDRSVPFRYRFFVELSGVDEARLAAALHDIGGEQRVFGRY